jgi:rod shape-determining protein MreB
MSPSVNKATDRATGIGNAVVTTDQVLSPHNYVISDFQGFELLLRSALKKMETRRWFPPTYRIFICVPTGLTEIEKRAYRDSGEHAGAKEVYMLWSSCATAIGMGILFEKKHFIVIDFSASKFEITVFANGLIVSDGFLRMGVSKIHALLRNHFFRKYNTTISDTELEQALRELADDKQATVKIQHLPITRNEIDEVLHAYFVFVNDMFQETIERVASHPDIAKIVSNGIFFTGGGSAFEYLRKQIHPSNRIRSTKSENPNYDCIQGLKTVMNSVEQYKNYLMT